VSDAEEEFSIDYEDICTTNISDDSYVNKLMFRQN
jgi:hypothetical protein